jgi:hypothetical protein
MRFRGFARDSGRLDGWPPTSGGIVRALSYGDRPHPYAVPETAKLVTARAVSGRRNRRSQIGMWLCHHLRCERRQPRS